MSVAVPELSATGVPLSNELRSSFVKKGNLFVLVPSRRVLHTRGTRPRFNDLRRNFREAQSTAVVLRCAARGESSSMEKCVSKFATLLFVAGVALGAPPLCQADQIAAGANHTVAVVSDGTVWTWGANGSGQ